MGIPSLGQVSQSLCRVGGRTDPVRTLASDQGTPGEDARLWRALVCSYYSLTASVVGEVRIDRAADSQRI